MLVIMDERQGKDFIPMNKWFYVLVASLVIFTACEENNDEVYIDELPYVLVNEQLNLSLPAYNNLHFRNYIYLDNVGLKGIVIVKRGEHDYAAFERTCPFEPEKECSIIDAEASGIYLECRCGNAFYNPDGFPTSGPSPRKLREYYSYLSGNVLTISSEPL
jgi:hypothetical protein